MTRGRVVSDEARAWSMGRLRSSDYLARARRRAMVAANDAVRSRLHKRGFASLVTTLDPPG